MNMENNEFRRFAPVRVGEELDVRIEAVGEKGDGVCKKKGFVLFVPGVREGDEVRIRVTKVLRKVGFAERIGDAQGPIQEDTPPPRRFEKQNDDYAKEAKEIMKGERPKAKPADTDNFGEESDSDYGEEPSDSVSEDSEDESADDDEYK